MRVSIFTPSHDVRFLGETYDSIKNQDFYEWILLLNGEARKAYLPSDILNDKRVVIRELGADSQRSVGDLKLRACSLCTGEILLELDHDDLLTPDSVATVRNAFETTGAVLVYSNCCEINHETKRPVMYGNATPETNYDSIYHWVYRDFEWNGLILKECIAPPTDPYHSSVIWYQPNHVRAYRAQAYRAVGGHNPKLDVCDDQDLMCRLFLYGNFYHINKSLYIYRVHGDNTWLLRNQRIQDLTIQIRAQYIRQMIGAWAKRNGFLMIDLGGALNSPEGYLSIDIEGADINHDLNNGIPLADNTVAVVRACDFLEHIKDSRFIMSEIHRVLVPGGYLMADIPSTDGRGAFQDPTHVSFWNENSFWYYTDARIAKYIKNNTIRFKKIVLSTEFYSEWYRTNNIPYVRADLLCMKDSYISLGEDTI